MKKKVVHYINNKDLVTAILAWQGKCREADRKKEEKPILPDYIGKCILQICEGLSRRYNFVNYTYKQDMVSDGIEKCVAAVKNFDINKTNQAFAYLTMVCFKAFQYRIIVERKQQYIKHKYYVHRYTVADIDGHMHEGTDNEYTNRVIEEYEKKHIQPKEETKAKKGKKNVQKGKFTFGSAATPRQSRGLC